MGLLTVASTSPSHITSALESRRFPCYKLSFYQPKTSTQGLVSTNQGKVMTESTPSEKSNFLYSGSCYHGHFNRKGRGHTCAQAEAILFSALCRDRREQGFKSPTEQQFSGFKSGRVESPELVPSARMPRA